MLSAVRGGTEIVVVELRGRTGRCCHALGFLEPLIDRGFVGLAMADSVRNLAQQVFVLLLSLWQVWRGDIAAEELWLQLEGGTGEVVVAIVHLMMCLLAGTAAVGVLVAARLQLGIVAANNSHCIAMIKQLAPVRGNAVGLVHLGW